MNDSILVRGFQRFRNLSRNLERLINRYRSTLDALGQRFSTDEFHYEEVLTGRLLESVDRRNVRMIQRCQHSRFAFESSDPFGVVTECFGKELDGNTAAQFQVSGLIHLSHAT